ncbi:MAG: class I SAM-dependent methyltransferase [bacterium]
MQNANEQKLNELIAKWNSHAKRRNIFLKWQNERIWHEKYQEKTIDFLEKFVPSLKTKKILDLGSGMGGFLVAMKLKGYDVIGIEPNHDYIDIAKLRAMRYGIDIDARENSGEKMPFPDDSIDFIYCNDVLEHCENPSELLKESFRILKENGQMHITVINRFGFHDAHYHLKFINWMPRFLGEMIIKLNNIEKENSTAGMQKLSSMHYFTVWQFKKMARESGFDVVDLKKYKILHPELIADSKFQKISKIFRFARMGSFIYFLAVFYLSSFSFMLKKTK